MPWLNDQASIAYKIYQIYMQTLDIFMKPQISDFFDSNRQKTRAELLGKLHSLLRRVYFLESLDDDSKRD